MSGVPNTPKKRPSFTDAWEEKFRKELEELDKQLDGLVGKTITALWVTSTEGEGEQYDVLHIRAADSAVDLRSADSEGYSSWLELPK